MDAILHFRPPSSGVALVTGANGITGQAIIDRLVKEPFEKWSVTSPPVTLSPSLWLLTTYQVEDHHHLAQTTQDSPD